MNTSIVVSMYNSKIEVLEIIEKMFIPSLINNAGKDKELIILDDFSPLEKETKRLINSKLKVLRRVFGKVVFSRNPKNLGFGESYNRAISMAKGNNIVITNDDVYFPKGSIDSFSSFLDSHEVGAIGPITGWREVCTSQYCKLGPKLKGYNKESYNKIEEFHSKVNKVMKGDEYKTKILTGFCFATKRKILKKVGMFDSKTFGLGYLEDTDLIRRIAKINDVLIVPSIYVHHGGMSGGSSSFNQIKFKAKKSYIINCFRYMIKWKDPLGLGYLWLSSFLRYFDIGTFSRKVENKLK